MNRLYQLYIEQILTDYNKMVFISGPRQVGKTTISKQLTTKKQYSQYLNWDYTEDRDFILNKHNELFEEFSRIITDQKPRIIFDEIHKFDDWKNLIKGFYDKFNDKIEFIITGSAKLNIYKKGGDSLMGSYINMSIHPLSVAEITGQFSDIMNNNIISKPKEVKKEEYEALYRFGGFVESYLKASEKFHTIWSNQRFEQLFREDVRNIEDIKNIYSLELLATIINQQAGQLTSYTSLSKKVRVSDQTIRRWVSLLEKHYYCFCIRPWSVNVTNSLLKEPKYYLWDWSQLSDEGARFENFVASHLFKAVNFWNEVGYGKFNLHYVRDKQKRKVDFLITKNNVPWILVEAKLTDTKLSESLKHFHNMIKPEHSFQVVHNLPSMKTDCFIDNAGIKVVPAISFLAQLV